MAAQLPTIRSDGTSDARQVALLLLALRTLLLDLQARVKALEDAA